MPVVTIRRMFYFHTARVRSYSPCNAYTFEKQIHLLWEGGLQFNGLTVQMTPAPIFHTGRKNLFSQFQFGGKTKKKKMVLFHMLLYVFDDASRRIGTCDGLK